MSGQLGRDEWLKNRRLATYGVTLFSMLWVANLIVWPFADLAAGGLNFSWPQAMERLGIESLVFLLIIAVVFLTVPFFCLLSAAARHHQHASWPPGNAVSRKCALWLLPGYFSVATIASNGIPSWSQSAQWQVFTSLYLIGAFAVVTVGIWIADHIGRSRMKWRFGTRKVPRARAVSIVSHQGSVQVVLADGQTVNVPTDEFKAKKELSTFFDNVVSASLQQHDQQILLVTECGDVFVSANGLANNDAG